MTGGMRVAVSRLMPIMRPAISPTRTGLPHDG
jgi:hypothetical protein